MALTRCQACLLSYARCDMHMSAPARQPARQPEREKTRCHGKNFILFAHKCGETVRYGETGSHLNLSQTSAHIRRIFFLKAL